jgi:hypothetical protein
LSATEFQKMTGLRSFIQANGNGHGICNKCATGAQGSARRRRFCCSRFFHLAYPPPASYNGRVSVWKAVSILAVLALLGLWAAVVRRH